MKRHLSLLVGDNKSTSVWFFQFTLMSLSLVLSHTFKYPLPTAFILLFCFSWCSRLPLPHSKVDISIFLYAAIFLGKHSFLTAYYTWLTPFAYLKVTPSIFLYFINILPRHKVWSCKGQKPRVWARPDSRQKYSDIYTQGAARKKQQEESSTEEAARRKR